MREQEVAKAALGLYLTGKEKMSKATESRELRLLIESILEDKGVLLEGALASLAFELTTAVSRFREEVKQGRTPAEAKASIQAAIIRGARKQLPRMEMGDRIEKACKQINYNFHGASDTEKERLIEFALTEQAGGRTIEKFVSWAINDSWWFDKISSVGKIMELWYKQTEPPKGNGRGKVDPVDLAFAELAAERAAMNGHA